MKKVPVLSNMASNNTGHISGDAQINSQRWRFVCNDGQLKMLYKYRKADFNWRHNYIDRAKKVAQLISEAALSHIPSVFEKCERERAEREAVIKAQDAISDRIERIEKLGPKLLASLKELIFCLPVFLQSQ